MFWPFWHLWATYESCFCWHSLPSSGEPVQLSLSSTMLHHCLLVSPNKCPQIQQLSKLRCVQKKFKITIFMNWSVCFWQPTFRDFFSACFAHGTFRRISATSISDVSSYSESRAIICSDNIQKYCFEGNLWRLQHEWNHIKLVCNSN